MTSYSSSSSSSSYDRKKKRKKDKKKRSKSKKKRSKHKHKKSKKKKKKTKKRKKKKKRKHKNECKDKTLLEGNMSIYKPREYREGAHGFITASNIHDKKPEFIAWLMDIHGVSLDTLVPRDERKWFASFCDDWNTSTMPNDKYYNLDKWNKANGGGDVAMIHGNGNREEMMIGMSDEQRLNMKKREERKLAEERRTNARIQAMKEQLTDLKSRDKRGFENLNDQYAPTQETFASLRRKREQKKTEDRVKRFGKYDIHATLD